MPRDVCGCLYDERGRVTAPCPEHDEAMAPFDLIRVDLAGVPETIESYDNPGDALDDRDQLRTRSDKSRVFYGVIDREDPERGWLEREET